MQIAVDGPSGSGKSTVCRLIAEKYGLIYLDTGAMYRAVAWISLNFAASEDELIDILENSEFIFTDNGKRLCIDYFYEGRKIYKDLTDAIRTPEVTNRVSSVASYAKVREILTKKQREIAKNNNVILDGRDIGTVVLPNADLKFFLTASAEERAVRRTKEWVEKGISVKYEDVLSDIIKRDRADSERKTAPLTQAPDAIKIDTTYLTIYNIAGIIGAAIEELRINGVK